MLFISRLIFTLLLLCFLWLLLVIGQIENPTRPMRWVKEAYELKETKALEINANKIIIVSGSNGLYGIDSERLRNYYGRPVINTAVHAGLGPGYILNRSKTVAKKGDIIFLPFEYAHYQRDSVPSEMLTSYLLSYDVEYIRLLSWYEQWRIFAGLKFTRLYAGYMEQDFRNKEDINNFQNINAYGDRINIEPTKMTRRQQLAIKNLKPEEIYKTELSSYFIGVMGEYLTWAKTQGVCIIVMPPSFMFFDEYRKKPYPEFFSNIRTYFISRDVSFVGDPYSYMYEKKYFFDTRYHLNSDGVQKRNQKLIDDLGQNIDAHCVNIH